MPTEPDHDHVDMKTLEEVERLLTSIDFVSAEELLSKAGPDQWSAAPRRHPANHAFDASSAQGQAPLPKRA
jgi:hypothetical protein